MGATRAPRGAGPLPFAAPLYLVTDRSRFPAPAPGEAFADAEWRVLDAAIAAGVGALQLREKDLGGRELVARAKLLAGRCRASGVKLLINDRVDVALAADADGVHLPARGMPVAEARRLLGPGKLVGHSLHGPEELAAAAGADFVLFGPVYDTPSKRAFGPPQGLERLAGLVARARLPVLAIGGVVPDRVGQVLAQGAAGVAAMGAILDAADPAAAVRAFLAAASAGAAAAAPAPPEAS